MPEFKHRLCTNITDLVHRNSGASINCSHRFRSECNPTIELSMFPAFREAEETRRL